MKKILFIDGYDDLEGENQFDSMVYFESDITDANTFLEYDAVIYSDSKFDDYYQFGNPSRRYNDMQNALERGCTLISIGCDNTIDFLNRENVNIVSYQMLNCSDITFSKNTNFNEFLSNNEVFLNSTNYFSLDSESTEICSFKKGNKVLGFSRKLYNGTVIVLPRLELEGEKVGEFYNAFSSLVSDDGVQEVELPQWTESLKILNEKKISKDIIETYNKLDDLNKSLKNKENELKEIKSYKHLITGTGITLEKVVEKVLMQFDVKFLESLSNRDDFIIEHDGNIAVIEVKGVKGSCALKHVRQLENWITSYNGDIPKGILIINTFRERELDNRNEKDFPDNVIEFSTKRDHCLITGITLLKVLIYITENPREKEKVINDLLKTVGIYNPLYLNNII